MPALSDQSQTDEVTVSWADNKFLHYFLAFCRAERERESQLRFMVVLQIDPMAFIISLEIPRMFGDDRLGYEASFFENFKPNLRYF